ncbi:glycosyltransferase family 2 protein [Polychytrium aggregatum]|uniref:glycosyltransferase family 2 protein n=1 Tax=Polychytrium aggregatum TaxID=110093 RepID=UPI0022FEF337|nr:glycosyltransferase family 2 protein [Polychytrium aggregatum]KAI9193287.1 glycosyltransferase family 2 protein [Polychytrium aggregatum]
MQPSHEPRSGEDLSLLQNPSTVEAVTDSIQDGYVNRKQSCFLIGSHFLIVVNNGRVAPDERDVQAKRVAEVFKSRKLGLSLESCPVSIFDFAARAWERSTGGRDQAVVFIGGYGQSPTEVRRLFTQQLVALSQSVGKIKSTVHSGAIKMETVLESFGHAQLNDRPNTSRYGRYTEYQLDDKHRMVGIKLLDFLLEKSHLTRPLGSGERNFNVFYQILAGVDSTEQRRLHLSSTDSSEFVLLEPDASHAQAKRTISRVLSSRKNTVGKGQSAATKALDEAQYHELCSHLKSLGIGSRAQAQIRQVVVAILHLGNVDFVDDPEHHNEACAIKSMEPVERAADLLGVSAKKLALVLSSETRVLASESVSVLLIADGAKRRTQTLAKALYSLLFAWLIDHLNKRLCRESSEFAKVISTLDFPVAVSSASAASSAGLESLLWSYANERWRSLALQYMFEEWSTLRSQDGLSIPSRFEDHGRTGYILTRSILDQISERPADAGSDYPHLETAISSQLQAYPAFGKSSSSHTFSIRHFFATVDYDSCDFVSRNTETLSTDFISLFRGDVAPDEELDLEAKPTSGSEVPFVSFLFSSKIGIVSRRHPKNKRMVLASQPQRPLRRPTLSRKRALEQARSEGDTTLIPLIMEAFDDIEASLSSSEVSAILTLNSNQKYNNPTFDREYVYEQVQRFGLHDLAVAKAAANYRTTMSKREFLTKFQPILPAHVGVEGDSLIRFFRDSGVTERDAAVGDTQVFLSESQSNQLRFQLQQATQPAPIPAEPAGGSGGASPRSSINLTGNVAGALSGGFGGNINRMSFASYADSDAESNFASEFEFSSHQPVPSGPVHGMSEIVGYSPATGAVLATTKSPTGAASPKIERKITEKKEIVAETAEITKGRRAWVRCTWCLTWWIPTPLIRCCSKMQRPDIIMAWREKVALCILIFFVCAVLGFYIFGLQYVLCPTQNILSHDEVQGRTTSGSKIVSSHGRFYDISSLANWHVQSFTGAGGIQPYQFVPLYGTDVSNLFYKTDSWDYYCPGIQKPSDPNWDYLNPNVDWMRRPGDSASQKMVHRLARNGAYQLYLENLNQYAKGRVGWTPAYLTQFSSQSRMLLSIYDNVYDVTAYSSIATDIFPKEVRSLFTNSRGNDMSSQWTALRQSNPALYDNALNCMNSMFYIGTIDHRGDTRCVVASYVLLSASIILVLIIGVKFLAALQFGSRKDPENNDKFVVIQVPCYTEGVAELSKTIESVATLRYDDRRKLIFIICDGMIVGSGNEQATPRIVLDILGVGPEQDPEPLSFQSLGEGNKQHNMGKVYCGLYENAGHRVPFIVVVKVGKPSELTKPGNRGKRDSQLVLMRFFNRVHYKTPMSPLELELFRCMKNVIGVSPSFYEYVLMVDADTEIMPDSLNRMISFMVHDAKVVGLCGETLLSNEKDSWVTMIQVYEYFISHHLAKAFESLFGSVTCLPGCFCLYRLRSSTHNKPLLVNNAVLNDYSENTVDTLHKKNLLHLGEDRYLTTLLLKHFPDMKTCFTVDAKCMTTAPTKWNVLLSQRRRWINSTVHNLLELVLLRDLCGFCCFSMRFVVLLDLVSTFTQPIGVIYVIYLIVVCSMGAVNLTLASLILIAAIYGFQMIILLLKQQWQHIGWMIIYLLALPVFSLYLPLYSFWHFDDFSWGNTRVVVGEGKKTVYVADEEPFNPKSIPLQTWADYEQNTLDTEGQSQKRLSFHSIQSFATTTPSLHNYPSTQQLLAGYGTPTQVTASSVRSSFDENRIAHEVTNILQTADLMKITKKEVRAEVARRLGLNLEGRRERDAVNKIITEKLQHM